MGKSRWVALAVAAALAAACSVGSNEPKKPLFRKVPAPETPMSCQLPVTGGNAAGIGDPYYPTDGATGYDVEHYDLKLRYDPPTNQLTGTAVIKAKAQSALSRVHLDFHGMKVDQAQVNDVKARSVDRAGDELTIQPETAVAAGSTFTVRIDYSGVPEEAIESDFGANGFLHTADGAFVMGEPHSATTWFPNNDHPRDKALYSIEITHPANLAGITNGVRKSQSTKDGLTTSVWQVNSPMATYLATLAIGNYRVTESTHKGIPVIDAVHNSITNTQIDKDIARNGEVLDFLVSKFGPYPFDALGGVVINDDRIGFALETQTRPMYSDAFWGRGASNTDVIAHELAHQWFGDSVSVDTWQQIWLNEGFASYAQWMWTEHQGGSTAQQEFDRRYNSVSSPIWRVAPGCPGTEELFGSATYNRGPMVLHTLRKTVGEDKFLEILKTWAVQKRDGNAKISEFIEHSEKVSGQQLDEMFDAWLFTKSRPR